MGSREIARTGEVRLGAGAEDGIRTRDPLLGKETTNNQRHGLFYTVAAGGIPPLGGIGDALQPAVGWRRRVAAEAVPVGA